MADQRVKAASEKAVGGGLPRKRRDWTGAGLALLIGIAGLAAGRFGHIWIRFDVFSQFFIQFALLALAGAVGLLVPRFKGVTAIALFAVFIAAYGSWPFWIGAPQVFAPAASGSTIKVAQFNIHGSDTNPDAIAKSIVALDADVMSLVEVTPSNRAMLDTLKAQWPYQQTCWQDVDCEVAIISKLPLTAADYRSDWTGPHFISASLGPKYAGTLVVATHTTRFPYSKAQFKQIVALGEVLAAHRGPLLVMGDFNATPFSRVTETFAASLGLTRLTYLPSWPATHGFPQLAIDHIFGSADIRALSHEAIGPAGGSDHFPVAITVAIGKN